MILEFCAIYEVAITAAMSEHYNTSSTLLDILFFMCVNRPALYTSTHKRRFVIAKAVPLIPLFLLNAFNLRFKNSYKMTKNKYKINLYD